jgi:hypothetical protein
MAWRLACLCERTSRNLIRYYDDREFYTMYKIALILIVALFSCSASVATANQTSEVQLAKAFLESIQSRDFNRLQSLTPSLPVLRKVLPEELKNLSDKALKARIEKLAMVKLRKDFNNILEDAKAKQIDLAQLEFLNAELHDGESKDNKARAMEVFYSYKGKKGSFALSVAEIEGKYYLAEILRSYQVLVQ